MIHSSVVRLDRLLAVTFLGTLLVLGSLLLYQAVLSRPVTEGTQDASLLESVAYATLLLILGGLALAFLGGTVFLKRIGLNGVSGSSSRVLVILSSVLQNKRCGLIFVLSALAYGVFFGVVSSTLVYQPGVIFSDAYGVAVPSIATITCCGAIGEMPEFVVYGTQHFAVLLIPINLVLLFTVSWLVGLNAGIAAFAYENRPKIAGGRWLSGLGAIVGLFTACPTCAGFFLLTMLGLGGALSLAPTLANLQVLFIAVGIPLLVATPILTCRRILTFSTETCVLPGSQIEGPKN